MMLFLILCNESKCEIKTNDLSTVIYSYFLSTGYDKYANQMFTRVTYAIILQYLKMLQNTGKEVIISIL